MTLNNRTGHSAEEDDFAALATTSTKTNPASSERITPTRMSQRTIQAGRLSVRSMNFGIPTNTGAQEHVEDLHGDESWRLKILKVLHSPNMQKTLMALLFLDVVILFIEIFLLATYPPCTVIERDCISCCKATAEDDAHDRFLAEEHHEDFCEAGLEATYENDPGCDEHKWSQVHTAEQVLFSFTILILSTFLVELHLEMIALGPGIFFRQVFYLLDYFIITVSMVLELLFHFASSDILQSVAGLLVFFRLWRFVRIGHGIVEIASEWTHMQYEELFKYVEELETSMGEHDLPLPESSQTIHQYLIDSHNSSGNGQHEYPRSGSAIGESKEEGPPKP
jgi:hypothetical protein